MFFNYIYIFNIVVLADQVQPLLTSLGPWDRWLLWEAKLVLPCRHPDTGRLAAHSPSDLSRLEVSCRAHNTHAIGNSGKCCRFFTSMSMYNICSVSVVFPRTALCRQFFGYIKPYSRITLHMQVL